MPAPTITLDPTSGPAGTVVTVTVVRGTPPTPITITATTPAGSGTATLTLIEALQVTAEDRELTVISDDGLTWVGQFTA